MDDLLIAVFHFSDDFKELQEIYNAEQERSVSCVTQQRSNCFPRHFETRRWKIATMYHEPDKSGLIFGWVEAVLKLTVDPPTNELIVGLDFVPNVPAGMPVTWIDNVGDWGYGIDVNGVRTTRDSKVMSRLPPKKSS